MSNLNIFDTVDKTLQKTSDKQDNGLLMTGLGSIALGSIAGIWFPAYNVAKLGFYTLGVLSIGLNFIDYKWNKIFRVLELYRDDDYPKIVKKIKREYGYDLFITLPLGLSLQDFEKKKHKIEQHLNAKLTIDYCNKHIFMKVVERKLKSLYEYKIIKTEHPLELLIGYIEHDKIKTMKLDHQKPHVLIGGMTGWGKTKFIIQMMVNLILNSSPKDIIINLWDFKGVDYGYFKDCPHIRTFIDNISDAEKSSYKLLIEMNKRINILKQSNCHNLEEYNKQAKEKIPYIINIIDEFADLQDSKKVLQNIDELLRKARAVGIHNILCTQRASREILPGTLKANIPVTIVFKTKNRVNSQIFLDTDSAANLSYPGRGILLTDKECEFQAMYIDDGEEKKWLKC